MSLVLDYDWKTVLTLCLPVHRPCAMVVPDFELICEIMLVAEGFIEARLLARKFITLYQLCKELLSKQVHSQLKLENQSCVIAPLWMGSWVHVLGKHIRAFS